MAVHEKSHDGGNQPRFWVNCGNDEYVYGVNMGADLPRALRPLGLRGAATSEMRVSVDDRPERTVWVATRKESPDRWTTFNLQPGGRTTEELRSLLAKSRLMTVHWFDLPPLSFHLAEGRPVIVDFVAKCKAMLRELSIVEEDFP